jgi:hypothetical protein
MSVKPFEKLTPAGKRCRIARDVLAQLNAKKLVAEHNTYLALAGEGGDSVFFFPGSEEKTLKELHYVENKTCNVCALGAILSCKVQYENGILFEDANNHTNITENLSNYFSVLDLNVIELAFEGHTDGTQVFSPDFSSELRERVKEHRRAVLEAFHNDPRWSMVTWSSSDRADYLLRDIMHNIIAHQGTFKLTNKPAPAPVKSRNQFSPPKDNHVGA